MVSSNTCPSCYMLLCSCITTEEACGSTLPSWRRAPVKRSTSGGSIATPKYVPPRNMKLVGMDHPRGWDATVINPKTLGCIFVAAIAALARRAARKVTLGTINRIPPTAELPSYEAENRYMACRYKATARNHVVCRKTAAVCPHAFVSG